MQPDNSFKKSNADHGNQSRSSTADREKKPVKGSLSISDNIDQSADEDLFNLNPSGSDNQGIGKKARSFNIFRRLLGAVKNLFGTVKTAVVTAFKVHTVAAISVATIVVSLVAGIVGAISSTTSSISGVLDYVPPKKNVLVRSAATGNSDYEPAHDGFSGDRSEASINSARREMARRIWSVFSLFYKDGSAYRGLRPEQICAVLGNWEVESQLDPTAVESVYDEAFMIGNTKQQASMYDFITDFGWSDDEEHFKKYKAVYKAGVGLAQWTDVRPVKKNADGSTYEDALGRQVLDTSSGWKFDISNPGRNTKLMTYAKQYGMEHYMNYKGDSVGWNNNTWIVGDSNTEGYWYDPKIQLAYAIDTSELGDSKAGWLKNWVPGDTSGPMSFAKKTWNGDIPINLGCIKDQLLEGWDAPWSNTTGWGTFSIKDNIVNIQTMNGTASSPDPFLPVIGFDTRDSKNFVPPDLNRSQPVTRDSYYDTPNTEYVNKIEYDKWTLDNGGKTDWGSWNRSSLISSSTIRNHQGIYNNLVDDGDFISSDVSMTARIIALTYAEKTADACWHGRLNDNANLSAAPNPNVFSKIGSRDFLVHILSSGSSGPYHSPDTLLNYYGVDYHQWEDTHHFWNKKNGDAPFAANKAAFERYKCCLRYFYRYHLYRYMTLYYATQFAKEYEGTSANLKDRQMRAVRWFQMWWDAGQYSNTSPEGWEPNDYAGKETNFYVKNLNPNHAGGINTLGFNDTFFRPSEGYTSGIRQGLKYTRDNLEYYEKNMKLYEYDKDMAVGNHIKKLDTSEIAQAAATLADPPGGTHHSDNGTQCYQYIHKMVFGVSLQSPVYNGTAPSTVYKACDYSAATAIRWSGCDDNFPATNTFVQMEYLCSSPRWTEIDWGGDEKCLQPGDVLIKRDYEDPGKHGHIIIYCGNSILESAPRMSDTVWPVTFPDDYCIVHGSLNSHGPIMDVLGSHRDYRAFRCTDPMDTTKSIFNGISY